MTAIMHGGFGFGAGLEFREHRVTLLVENAEVGNEFIIAAFPD